MKDIKKCQMHKLFFSNDDTDLVCSSNPNIAIDIYKSIKDINDQYNQNVGRILKTEIVYVSKNYIDEIGRYKLFCVNNVIFVVAANMEMAANDFLEIAYDKNGAQHSLDDIHEIVEKNGGILVCPNKSFQ